MRFINKFHVRPTFVAKAYIYIYIHIHICLAALFRPIRPPPGWTTLRGAKRKGAPRAFKVAAIVQRPPYIPQRIQLHKAAHDSRREKDFHS